jgi:hypothetical protein
VWVRIPPALLVPQALGLYELGGFYHPNQHSGTGVMRDA